MWLISGPRIQIQISNKFNLDSEHCLRRERMGSAIFLVFIFKKCIYNLPVQELKYSTSQIEILNDFS